jgi:hypothetical protein
MIGGVDKKSLLRIFKENYKKEQIKLCLFRDAWAFDKSTWQTTSTYTLTKEGRK